MTLAHTSSDAREARIVESDVEFIQLLRPAPYLITRIECFRSLMKRILPARRAQPTRRAMMTCHARFSFYPNRIPSVGRNFWQIETVSYFVLWDDGNGVV